jgi:hypothetical protein
VSSVRRAGALALATLLWLAVATSTTASDGGLGIRLVDVPASAAADPRARLYIIDHLAPGTTIERRVEVSNSTAAPLDVLTYAAAAVIDHGSFTGAAGRTANELSRWTTVTPGDSLLPAGSVATIDVAISVPADAAPGEQYGVVWAEARSAPVAGTGVVQVSRVGIRLYISVGPGGAPAPDFTISALTASRSSKGTPVISAGVRNIGGRALDMNGSLRLTDGPGGLSAGPFPATLGVTLAVGATDDVEITLDARVPDGPWRATIVLRSGLTERTASAVIQFPPVGSAAPVTVESGSGSSLGLAVMVSIAALATAALVVVFVVARRRRAG